MTTVSVSSTGPGVQLATSAHNEWINVLAGVTLESTTSEAVLLSHFDTTLMLDGFAIGATSGVRAIGASSAVTVGANGFVETTSTAMNDAAVLFQAAWFGHQGFLENFGIITADFATAVQFEVPDSLIVNRGLIVGASGVRLTGSAGDTTLINFDTIISNGIEGMAGSPFGNAVYSDATGTFINNRAEATILATGGGVAIYLDAGASGAEVRNLGTIESTDNVAIFAENITGPDGIEIYLVAGSSVTGAGTAMSLSQQDDVVDGTSAIIGDAHLNGGDDIFDVLGAIQGDIYGGTGADVITATQLTGVLYGGSGDDTLTTGWGDDSTYGGAGNDTLNMGHGDDWASGGDDNDILNGWNGDDVLFGGAGDDEVVGHLGGDRLVGGRGSDFIDALTGNTDGATDTLIGGAGDDTLVAGKGDDILDGGGSDDVMHGGAGHDILLGGTGADLMTGAAGNDQFVFVQVADSAIGSNDTIVDFTSGDDLIDLMSLGLSVFVGTSGFTGSGSGEVRYDVFGSVTLMQIDADGDGIADMEIELQGGVGGLTAADFLL